MDDKSAVVKKIGIISDTHGILYNKVFDIFANVEMIIHAGDIGSVDVLAALQTIAPVHAVYGNTDNFDIRRYTKFLLNIEYCGALIIVTHIPTELEHVGNNMLIKIFGHTHYPEIKTDKDGLLINPGTASKPRDGNTASVAMLHFTEELPPRAEIIYYKVDGL